MADCDGSVHAETTFMLHVGMQHHGYRHADVLGAAYDDGVAAESLDFEPVERVSL